VLPQKNDNEKSFAEFAKALSRNGERLDTFEKNIITLQERISKVNSEISEIQILPPSSILPTISIIIPVMGDARATSARTLRGNQLAPILVFLEKEYAKTQNSYFEVIVVGEEGDRTLTPLKNSKLVSVIFMEKERTGWADYIEKGAKAARGDFFFFLSADALVPTSLDAYSLFTLEWTEALMEIFEDESIAVVTPKILSQEGYIYSTGLVFQDVKIEEAGRIESHLLAVHENQGFYEADQRAAVKRPVDAVSPDAFIIRASAFTPLTTSSLFLLKKVTHPLLLSASICIFLREESKKSYYLPNLVVHKEYTTPARSSVESFFSGDKIDKTSFVEFNKLFWVLDSPLRKSVESRRHLDLNIVWDFYCGCTGWNIEVISYASTLETQLPIKLVAGNSDCFCNGFPEQTVHALERMRSAPVPAKVDVWISHKPPTSYPMFPYNGAIFYVDRPTFVIGRSMIESNAIPSEWANKAMNVDEIWLPANFLVPVFAEAGIEEQKLKVVPEQIDVHLWDPHAIADPFPLSNYTFPSPVRSGDFIFLSSFKWEHRKGWDILLTSYFRTFRASDSVILVLHTYLYLDSDPRNPERVQKTIMNWLDVDAPSDLKKIPKSDLPRYLIITDEIPQIKMPSLYKAANAFVLPTRGEGWGLPIMQAMAMELPTIATAWSGPLDFMTPSTSWMLPIEEELIPAEKEGFGKMAQPNIARLSEMLKEVMDATSEQVKEKGFAARKHIVDNFSAEVVSQIWMSHFQRLYKSYN